MVVDLYAPSSLDASEVVDRLEFDMIEPITALERLRSFQETPGNLSSMLNTGPACCPACVRLPPGNLSSMLNTVAHCETVTVANDMNAELRQCLDKDIENRLWKGIYSDMAQEANRTADLARAYS